MLRDMLTTSSQAEARHEEDKPEEDTGGSVAEWKTVCIRKKVFANLTRLEKLLGERWQVGVRDAQ